MTMLCANNKKLLTAQMAILSAVHHACAWHLKQALDKSQHTC